jgi:N-acetylglucosamine transport system permease protein
MRRRRPLLSWLLLSAYAAAILVPLAWVLISSLKRGDEIFASPWTLPSSPQWGNYESAWRDGGFATYAANTLFATLGTLILLLPIGAMAAYVLAKRPFPGSRWLLGVFMSGLLFPNFLVVVPLYVLMSQLGLFNTLAGLILAYVSYSLSFTVFVLHGFFSNLPDELGEAAQIDGCSEAQTFSKVMLPLARPGILVVGIFNAIGLWNEYNLAKVLFSERGNSTLPIGITNMVTAQQYGSNWGAIFAALVIVMLPVLIAYWFFRDKIHETMLAGAVKG